MFEEPCISGTNGSGTVFLLIAIWIVYIAKTMRLAKNGKGKEITVQNLSDIFVKQQEKGAHNINLVTPTMYVYQIIEAIKLARKTGLKIPIIYNSNGYENVETIKMLNGYIDVYLPDLKYYTNELSKKYSNVDNYFEVATNAIKEMYSQVGNAVLMIMELFKRSYYSSFSSSKSYSKYKKYFKMD